MSSLQERLASTCILSQRITVYTNHATSPLTALQSLLYRISHDYEKDPTEFIFFYTLRSKKLTTTQKMRIYEIGLSHGNTAKCILQDIESKSFWKLMQHYGASLDSVITDPAFGSLSYFKESLQSLSVQDLSNQHTLEDYLQTSLTYHQKDLTKSSNRIIHTAQTQGYSKDQLLVMSRPHHRLMIEDGSVSLENKDEIMLFQQKQELLRYEIIKKTPYFLFVSTKTANYFVGTQAYKQAILSYTSETARTARFDKHETVTADLLISDGSYQKIYIRGSQEDDNRWYDTHKTYPPHPQDYQLDTFFHSESGLTEISHLMTSHQDLIFRSPTEGTVLIEGVSGSGKTNLIFHRIDYLLQEHPETFSASELCIITPNDILKAYIHTALQNTSFTFKQEITIQTFDALHALPHPQHSTYQLSDTTHINTFINTAIKRIDHTHLEHFPQLLQRLQTLLNETFQALQHYYTTLSPLDQHVHSVGYTTDYKLLQETLCAVGSFQITHSPSIDLTGLQTTIERILMTTQKDHYKHPHLKKRYFDEFFDTIQERISTAIKTYTDLLLTTAHDSKTQGAYDTIYQSLHHNEKVLLEAYCTESYRHYVGISSSYRPYQYVLIDEFQDFHPLALQLLSVVYGKAMILSGDCMQSAWYHDIHDLATLGISLVDHRQMTDNFRNTLETLQYAHSVFGDEASSLFLANRVIKRGPKPFHVSIKNSASWSEYIHTHLLSIDTKATLAIVYFDPLFARDIYESYTNTYHEEALFPSLDPKHHQQLLTGYYSKRLYFMSYRECKGLEFDHIVLIDQQSLLSSDLTYKKKLWYIGCTRAVKTLHVGVYDPVY